MKMSELEQMKQLVANPNIEPAMAEVLRIRIAAFEAVLNGPRYLLPPAPKPSRVMEARQEP